MKGRVRSALGHLLGPILTPALAPAWLRQRAESGNRDRAPRSVLLVRFDLMGDVVNALAAAHAVRRRWPEAQVTFLAPPRWRAILQRCSAVDTVLPFDFGALTHWPGCLDFQMWRAAWRLLRRIRSRRFDLAVSIYGPIAGTVVACSGALVRVGYAAEAPRFSFDRALPGRRRNGGPHESVLAARLLGVDAAEWHTLDRTADLPLPDRVAKAESPLIAIWCPSK